MATTAISTDTNGWLTRPKPNPKARLRLYCFPYAGGAPQIFSSWVSLLPSEVEVLAICMPGRGRRFAEPAFTDMEPVMQALAPLLPLDKPFAFFGHSMGALIGFELARRIRDRSGREPQHLFVSACFAPHESDPRPIHHLAEPDFVRELTELNGMPREVLENRELIQLVMPMIRADFTLTETYAFGESSPLTCPLTAIGGTDDSFATQSNLEAWRRHTSGSFELRMFRGDHFYLHSAQQQLLSYIGSQLRRVLAHS